MKSKFYLLAVCALPFLVSATTTTAALAHHGGSHFSDKTPHESAWGMFPADAGLAALFATVLVAPLFFTVLRRRAAMVRSRAGRMDRRR